MYSLSASVSAAVVTLHCLSTRNICPYSDSTSLINIGRTDLQFLWRKPWSYCSRKLLQPCRRVLRHVEFHPLGLQHWPYAAWLLGNDFLRWFVSTKYSRGEHYWILPKMRHRGRKGGFRDWTHRYMSLECQSSAALRSLYLSSPCSKASSFFGVLSGNKGNRATETRGEVSRGKSHLFFRLRPLATSRPVLRSSAAWRLKSRTKLLGTRAEADTQAVFHRKVSWLGMRIETWKHLKRTIKLRLSPLFRLSFTTLLKLLSSVSIPIVKDHNTARYFLALLTMCALQNQPLPA